MDVSAMQSSSKCSSDFSIERILSEERSVREGPPAPSWLWCTRYQPPRIPRASSSSACRSRRSGRHARVPFTSAQAQALEAAYARAPYLAPPALRALAAALQLRDDRIKIWFQNRRARERRENCSTIVPPQAVTLPPTAVLPATTFIPPTTGIRVDPSVIIPRSTTNSWPHYNRQTTESSSLDLGTPQDLSNQEDKKYCDDFYHRRLKEDRPDSPLEVDVETIENT